MATRQRPRRPWLHLPRAMVAFAKSWRAKAVEVVWVYRENFPVVVLGFRELARLVMELPSSQQFWSAGLTIAVGGAAACLPILAVHRKAFDGVDYP
jgi:hypothetical protein